MSKMNDFPTDQEMLDGWAKEMKRLGHATSKCPKCKGYLWFEHKDKKKSAIMLMRYSTVFDGECDHCNKIKKEWCALS